MTSAQPSTAAASRSSRTRTVPRSPSGTSAGSLIDPASPCEAQTITTRQPASASRASVPPQASDSSSGWAKMPSTVRPARGSGLASGASGTVGLHDPGVDGDVFVDHALGAEAGDRALVHAASIEIEDARQTAHHRLEVVEDQSGHALVDDFADRAAVEGDHWRAAGHCFGEHQPERLARLDWVDQRPRASIQLHLRLKISLAKVDDADAVDVRRHALPIIVVFGGGEDQPHVEAL